MTVSVDAVFTTTQHKRARDHAFYWFTYLRFLWRFGLFFLRVFVLSMLVVLGLVFSILSQEIGWEERLQNEQFCVKWDMKLWAAGRASGL